MSSLPEIVSAEEWQLQRDELLKAEKEATRTLDSIAARRRRLPMVQFDNSRYTFASPTGPKTLLDLFEGQSQLAVYQFMDNGPDEFCPGCTHFTNNVANLDTLQLLSKLIPEYAGGINELAINRNKFELIFAFDEVVTGGCTSPQDVRTCTDMDSHEERVQQMVTKSKEKEARLIALKKQKEIEEMKRSGDYPLPHPLPAAKGIMIPPPKPPKPPARATLKPMVLARPVVTMPKDILDEW